MSSKNVLSADNQQERSRTRLHPWYITGFVEGEGTFHVAIYKDSRMSTGVKLIPEFHVSQSHLRSETLKAIEAFFNCGYIKPNHAKREKDTTYVYVVRNRQDLLTKILPFFKRYPLLSNKQQTLELFGKVVRMMDNGLHRNEDGLHRILDLVFQMNDGGKYRTKWKTAREVTFSKSSETIREIPRNAGKI